MKIKQRISYLKETPRAGAEKATKFRQRPVSNYIDRRAKIRHLQDENFIPFPDEDFDTLFDYIYDIILNEAGDLLLQK